MKRLQNKKGVKNACMNCRRLKITNYIFLKEERLMAIRKLTKVGISLGITFPVEMLLQI